MTAAAVALPSLGELSPEVWADVRICEPTSAIPAASEARRSNLPPSSEMRAALVPKEDHLRGEAPAEGTMLEGVLDPLSISLQRTQCSSNARACWSLSVQVLE